MFDGEVEVHWFSGTGEVIGGAVLDVSSSKLPGHDSGCSHDFPIDRGEFWPLKIWPSNVEGVFLPSVLKPEELSRISLVLVRVNVSGDVGRRLDSNGFGDVLIDEGIGVAGCGGVIV